MKKFDVLLERTVNAWVTVEAEDQEQADIAAIALTKDRNSSDAILTSPRASRSRWKVNRGYRCLDCGIDTSGNGEYPLMLRNEVWRSIVPNGKGMLCRKCIEGRLGHPLTDADYLVRELTT